MECVILSLSCTIKSKVADHLGTWQAQKYCLAMLFLCCRLSINTQFDFLYLTVYCLTPTWWEAAANGYLHQKLPSHSRLERPHLFPANELLPSVKLQLLTFVLFKSKLQGSCDRLSAASRYPALMPRCPVEGERDHCSCCFVTGCLSGLWQGAHTEQPWPCRAIQAERGMALGTCRRPGSCWPVMSQWRCFLCNALHESDLLIVRSLNKFRSLVCVCTP